MDQRATVLVSLLGFAWLVYIFLSGQPDITFRVLAHNADLPWQAKPGLCARMDRTRWVQYRQVTTATGPVCEYAGTRDVPERGDSALFTGCFADQPGGVRVQLSTQPGCMAAAPFA